MFEMLVTFNADINSKFVCLEFCKNFTFMLQIFIYTENVQNRLLPIPYHQQSLYSNKKRIHSKIEHIHSSVYWHLMRHWKTVYWSLSFTEEWKREYKTNFSVPPRLCNITLVIKWKIGILEKIRMRELIKSRFIFRLDNDNSKDLLFITVYSSNIYKT